MPNPKMNRRPKHSRGRDEAHRQMCNALLDCGHLCPKSYHLEDRLHADFQCKQQCSKKCKNRHVCKKLCYEPCGDCTIRVLYKLKCGHKHVLPCNIDLQQFKCELLVDKQLSCGHEITMPCCEASEQVECPAPCSTRVEPCGHFCLLSCHVNDDPEHTTYKCINECTRVPIDCYTDTHRCLKRCHEECPPCSAKTIRKPACGHWNEEICSNMYNEYQCKEPCGKKFPCDHKCKKPCHENCCEDCEVCRLMILKTLVTSDHEEMTKCSSSPMLAESQKIDENSSTDLNIYIHINMNIINLVVIVLYALYCIIL